jgi:predicted metal-dependent hydrolase
MLTQFKNAGNVRVAVVAEKPLNDRMTFTWPPPFTLHHSARVRSVRLQISSRRGLQLIVPNNFKPQQAAAIVEQHRQWIERAWRRLELLPTTTAEQENPPRQLSFLALNESWEINYQHNELQVLRLEKKVAAKQLIIHGKTPDQRMIKVVLQRWLQRYAKHYLTAWLEKLSRQTHLLYAGVTVRQAHTRWGSCSAKKSISLNCNLLFLPPPLVEYVLLHELCHTVYLNHSRHFWNLLKSVNPDCHALRKQLKQQRYVPAWLEKE